MRTSGLALVVAMGWACGGNTAHRHAVTSGAAPPTSVMAMEADSAFNTEAYDHMADNGFIQVADRPLSTFSIDVDRASYANIRRFLREGRLPPKDAVRIEEMVNYFSYDYPNPTGAAPFSVTTEVSKAPWNPKHQVVHIGLQGKRIAQSQMPARNLVFLVDVSGSMMSPDKLGLAKQALRVPILAPVNGKELEHEVMGYHTRQDIPVLYTLADEYTLCDHWHSSLLGGTWCNRYYRNLPPGFRWAALSARIPSSNPKPGS